MDTQNPPINEMPKAPSEGVHPVPPDPNPLHKKTSVNLWMGIVIGIILMVTSISAGLYLSGLFRTPNQNTAPQPTSIPTGSTRQERYDPISTTSAFLSMESSVASLSAVLSGLNPIDASVVPPVLDLPLGFSR